MDRFLGLEMGADDYLTKPFSPRELVARVRAILRRTREVRASQDAVSLGDLEVDLRRREARSGEKLVALDHPRVRPVRLPGQQHRTRPSRQQLLDGVWGTDWYGDERTVDVHVAQLRKKLGQICPSPPCGAWATGSAEVTRCDRRLHAGHGGTRRGRRSCWPAPAPAPHPQGRTRSGQVAAGLPGRLALVESPLGVQSTGRPPRLFKRTLKLGDAGLVPHRCATAHLTRSCPTGLTHAGHRRARPPERGARSRANLGNLVYAVAPPSPVERSASPAAVFEGTFAILLTPRRGRSRDPSWPIHRGRRDGPGRGCSGGLADEPAHGPACWSRRKEATGRIASGELARPAAHPSATTTREFASLAGSINDMAQRLEDSRARETSSPARGLP